MVSLQIYILFLAPCLASASSHLRSTQNNLHPRVAYFGVDYFATLHNLTLIFTLFFLSATRIY